MVWSESIMADGIPALWATGSIPWVEVILILVVVNILLLSSGGKKNAFSRWLTKTSKKTARKSKAMAVKAKKFNVSQKRKRASRKIDWSHGAAAPAGSFTVSKKRQRGDQNKGWGASASPANRGSFSVNNIGKRSGKTRDGTFRRVRLN